MTLRQLIEVLCREGETSIRKNETGAHREGGLRGFYMISKIRTIEELEKLLEGQHQLDLDVADRQQAGKLTLDDYWRQRTSTAQLEYVYEILKVAYRRTGKYSSLSTRAIQRYAKIVGIAPNKL